MKAIIAAAAAFCIALIGVAYYFATHQDSAGPRIVPLDPSYVARREQSGWITGAKEPKVEVIEYADLQCPACAAMHPVLNQVEEATKDIAQFHYRHYIIQSHDKSLQASKALEAAGRQGKFYQMKDLIFSRQSSWVSQTPSAFRLTLEDYAKTLQLNVDQYRRDIKDTQILDDINKNISQAEAIDLTATPTFVINGKKVEDVPSNAEDFIALIKKTAEDAPLR